MLDLYTMSIIVFFAVLGVLIYKDRKNIEFKYILLIRRTKKFRNFIDRISKVSPTFWKSVGTMAIITCIFFMIIGIIVLINAAYLISSGQITEPAFQFILPTPSATGSAGPGYILIPFWFWIIVIATILVPHELSHGIIARAEKIKLKSVGLLLLAVIPGAFVEPDEKQLQKSKFIKKLRVFSAGSFANFVIAFSLFFLILYFIWPAVTDPGIQIYNITEGSPANLSGLKPGMVITEINGVEIETKYCGLLDLLSGRLCTGSYYISGVGNPQPNDTLRIRADDSYYDVTLALNEETNRTYIGFTSLPSSKVDFSFFTTILPLLTMISLFNFGVGLVNILPIYPLDGGLIMKAITDKYFKKRSETIIKFVTYSLLLILIYDFVGPFL